MSREMAIDVVLMRGGTSKGVFVRAADLPASPAERDGFLLRLMGSPDAMQIDGLGGTHSSTSKVMVVALSDLPDVDVEYEFVQVGIERPIVDTRGNCGNLTPPSGHSPSTRDSLRRSSRSPPFAC